MGAAAAAGPAGRPRPRRLSGVAARDQTDAEVYAALWEAVQPVSARRLLVAALESFAEHGFTGATTRDIALRAGVSPAGVYTHYRSKADLLYEISLTGHTALLEAVRGAVAEVEGARPRMRAFVATYVTWHARLHTLARVTQYEIASLPPDRLGEIRRLRDAFEVLVQDELRAGVAAGEFAVDDLAGTALAILSLGIDVARWYDHRHRSAPGEVATLYAELVDRMLRPG